MVIEIDGGTHDDTSTKEYDSGREAEMKALGIETLRFSNKEVEVDLRSVLDKIKVMSLYIAENNQPITRSLKGGADFGLDPKPPSEGWGQNHFK